MFALHMQGTDFSSSTAKNKTVKLHIDKIVVLRTCDFAGPPKQGIGLVFIRQVSKNINFGISKCPMT